VPVPAAIAASLRARRAAVRRAVVARGVANARRAEHRGRRRRQVTIGALAVLGLGIFLPIAIIIIAIAGAPDPRRASGASAVALADIPAEALVAYQDAGMLWGIDWSLLAAVGKLECDHGRSQLSGCNPPDTINGAGARGYMQFIGTTWRRGLGVRELEPRSSPEAARGQGYATDGDSDGDADPWSWPDATHSAARYLVALGVTEDPSGAVFGYNHSSEYVAQVMTIAARYRTVSTTTSFQGTAGNVPLVTVEGITVHTQIGSQVSALLQAARSAGFELAGGGYRSPQQQIELRRAHCGSSEYAIYQMPASQCSPPTARPGSSNHERGLAIDFTCNGTRLTRGSACFQWLAGNAASYGFFNLPSEPWHWSVDGS